MRLHSLIAVVVLLACVTIAKPIAQTREKPLTGRELPKRPKYAKFVLPNVTAEDVGGQPALVMLEVLIDPSGQAAEAKMTSGPASIKPAVLAAVKQWKYKPAIVNGKGAWVRIKSSLTITPTNSAPGVPPAGVGSARQPSA